MAEYIEKNATIKDLELLAKYQYGERQQGILGVCETIKRKPAADVEEVIHAHWEVVEREAFWLSDADIWMKSGKPTIHFMPVCSHCKTEFGTIVFDFKRCPECGAKMDGERRSENG